MHKTWERSFCTIKLLSSNISQYFAEKLEKYNFYVALAHSKGQTLVSFYNNKRYRYLFYFFVTLNTKRKANFGPNKDGVLELDWRIPQMIKLHFENKAFPTKKHLKQNRRLAMMV